MIKIVKTISEYSKEYDYVLCQVVDIEDENKKEFEVKLAREEYELVEMLNKIQSGAGLYAPTMNALWERIQAYGRMKFKEGVSVNDEEQ